MNMPNKILLWLLRACFCFSLTSCYAEVLSVGHIENGVASTSDVTLTFLWKSDSARATLIMIPGGEGHLGLSPDRADMGGFYGNTLKPLSNPGITSGIFNVVIFDSPNALPVGNPYPISRATAAHLSRIEDVVQFYKAKFNKPVWLMGHSNGAVSITEFYRYLQRNQKEGIVSGMIYSSARNGAWFNSETNVPILFLAHEYDGCRNSTNANSLGVYKDLMKSNRQKMDYVLLKTGDSESQDACRSGHHMFFNAHEEAYKAIDRFASEVVK